jgi:hypothetical protein
MLKSLVTDFVKQHRLDTFNHLHKNANLITLNKRSFIVFAVKFVFFEMVLKFTCFKHLQVAVPKRVIKLSKWMVFLIYSQCKLEFSIIF